MLMGIAGCSAMDVISILKKKKVDVRGFRMDVTAERAEEHPQKFTRIHFHYIVTGKDVREADANRAIELTEEKYCGAIATIRGNVEMDWKLTIEEVG
jgi:putative redox protein